MISTGSTTSHTPYLKRSLYSALGGTLFLRLAGGVMGIMTGLFLAGKNAELIAIGSPFQISATLAGLIVASYFITELIGSFVSGRFIDRYGPRRYMILGPAFGAVAMIAIGIVQLTPDPWIGIIVKMCAVGRGAFCTDARFLTVTPSLFQFLLFLGLIFAARMLEGASAAAANPASLAYIAAYTSDD